MTLSRSTSWWSVAALVVLLITDASAGDVRVSGDAVLAETTETAVILKVGQPAGQATVVFTYEDPGLDLSSFRDIEIPVANRLAVEIDVFVSVSARESDGWRQGTTGRFIIRAGEESRMTALLAREALPKDHPHVKLFGGLFGYPWGHHIHWSVIDPGKIGRVVLSIDWSGAEAGQTIEVGKPRGSGDYSTDPALLKTFQLPMVDEFGQATWMDWPGKVHSIEELREDGRRDTAFAAAVTNPGPRFSRFGGLLDGPELEATGFFRVEKVGGKWWFVDPEGRLFWSVGVNAIGNGDETKIEGRAELFPESLQGEPKFNFYGENLKRKYGGDEWETKHPDVIVARMHDWGINTVGAWSSQDVIKTQRIPYTLILHTATYGIPTVEKMPDPFSPSFADSLDRGLGSMASRHADNPWLVGVFVDNELNWRGGIRLVEGIMQSPPRTPARTALVDFLRERYQNVDALNLAWGTKFPEFSDIAPVPGDAITKACRADLEDFLAVFADRYFGLCREAMRKLFPNHLYLGCRFHVFHPVITKAASRHCDVVSVNVYQHNFDNFAPSWDRDIPWLISEFHFGIRDHGNLGAGLTWASGARNQADIVQAYLSDALRHPNCVGAHWFQWSDQVATGRGDGENFGVGMVTIVDRPVKSLNDAIRTVSGALHNFRLGESKGRIGSEAPVQKPSYE